MNINRLLEILTTRADVNPWDELVFLKYGAKLFQIERCARILSDDGISRICLSQTGPSSHAPTLTLRALRSSISILVEVCAQDQIIVFPVIDGPQYFRVRTVSSSDGATLLEICR